MPTKNFEELVDDPNNPRAIDGPDFKYLMNSLKRFGDLGGFVFNVRLKKLAAGHQRKNAFNSMGGQKTVNITHTYDRPDRQGTVAVGFVEHDGVVYSYREVDWDEATHSAAMVAANRISGRWDLDKLAQLNYKLIETSNQELLDLTGQSSKEQEHLLALAGVGEPDPATAPKPPRLILKVEGKTDDELQQLFSELKERGFDCKLT